MAGVPPIRAEAIVTGIAFAGPSLAVWLLLALSAVPLLFVVGEIAAALFVARRGAAPGGPLRVPPAAWPRTVVLVPAHNEAAVIGRALSSLNADLPPNARIVCIAHNCSDGTAAIARNFGATVVEVGDDGGSGKPAALRAGLQALDRDPPDVVVIVDADCQVARGSLAALVTRVHDSGRPAMGTYLFAAADGTGGKATLSSLAILLKNHIRPLGLNALGLPCLLNGSGSAYPFAAIRQAPHGEGSIAEDFQLAIDLLRLGYPTSYVPEAIIHGTLPARQDSAMKQRRRWEHGHLALVFGTAPKLLIEGLRRFDLKRVALACEVGVPPLGLLGLCCGTVLVLAALLALLSGDPGPLTAALLIDALFVVAVSAAWIRFAGWSAAFVAVSALPAYLLWKLPLYFGYIRRRESVWRKTDRD